VKIHNGGNDGRLDDFYKDFGSRRPQRDYLKKQWQIRFDKHDETP